MNVSVSLKAVQQPDGSVICDLACDGQEARITFDGTNVITEIREPADELPGRGAVADYYKDASAPPETETG